MPSSDDVLRGLRRHEGERLPERFEILGELGRGGMAVVHRARDRQLGREVALKVLRDDLPVGHEERARFRREGEAAAKLSHPNIVAVLDAGETYLVLELVRGGAIRPGLETVPLLEKVARAVDHAHRHGVIHRDLKPSNVLVNEAGEPKVSDFGIARLLGETALTRDGTVLGTPIYMASEQVQGRVDEIGPRTDVYALGAMLYEFLSGKPPHSGETAMELFGKIVNEEPARIPGAPPELEAVALKALAKEPSRRYSTAGELADELERWRTGRPVLARPPSALELLRRKIARRKGVVFTAFAGLAALALVLVLLVPKLSRTRRALRLWTDVSVAMQYADAESRAGEVGRSRSRLDDAIARCREEGDLVEAHYFLGRLLRLRGRRDEAVLELDRAESMGEARYERGLLFVDLYGERIARVQSAYAGRRPSDAGAPRPEDFEKIDPELTRLRARAIEDLSITVGSSAYFREVDARFGRAELERMKWDFAAAREGLLDVLGREPLYTAARLSLARAALLEGDYDEAIAQAAKAIDQHRGSGEAYAIRSQALLWRSTGPSRDLEQALADAEKVAEIDGVRQIRGTVRLRMGDFDGALADFASPRDAIDYNHRGIARKETGDAPGALADFGEAIRLSPTFGTAYKNRALLRMMNGDRAGAKADAEKALEVSPPAFRAEIETLIRILR